MDKFIQKVLSCTDIKESDNLINSFPIIRINYQNCKKNLLVFRFYRNSIPNYLVIGEFKENTFFDKDTFISWLESLNTLIFSNPKEMKVNEYFEILNKFKNSRYFNQLLYSQEGFDLINGKEYFTNAGLIGRTVEVECQILPDRSIEFYQNIKFNETNQFLEGDFFRQYEDYEKYYFLNFYEYHTMSYLNVISYIKINAQRLMELFMSSSNINEDWVNNNIDFLLQSLDSYLANADKPTNKKIL